MPDEQTGRPADPAAARPARRRGGRPADPPAGKVAMQIKLPADLALKLRSRALGLGVSASDVVAELVGKMPARFVLSDRGRHLDSGDTPALGIVSEAI